jgi:hypothetical protein
MRPVQNGLDASHCPVPHSVLSVRYLDETTDDVNFSQSNRSPAMASSRQPDASSSESSEHESEAGVDEGISKLTSPFVVVGDTVPNNVNASTSISSRCCDEVEPLPMSAKSCNVTSTGVDFITFGGIDLSCVNDGPPGRLVVGYDSTADAWTKVSKPMSNFIHHHGVAVVDQRFYVVGER